MSTSANLPAGFSITSISGVRCTAVPKTATTLSNVSTATNNGQNSGNANTTTTSSAATSTTKATTSTTAAAQTTSSSTSTSTTSSSSTSTSTSSTETTSSSVAAVPAAVSTTSPATTTTPSAAPVAASTSVQSLSLTPPATSTEAATTTPASPAPSSTITPATTPAPVALSDSLPSSSTSSAISDDPAHHTAGGSHTDGTVHSSTSSAAISASTTAVTGADSSSTSSNNSGLSSTQSKTAPVVGCVVGGMAGLALIAFLFWYFRRRRNQRRRSTLLTPLGTGQSSTFYEIDKRSVGPTSRSTKWKSEAGWQFSRVGEVASGIGGKLAVLGTSLRTRVAGQSSDTPSVDLNRGHSQFLDGPIPQHSRTNSALSGTSHITRKDRFQDWIERVRENASFKWRLRSKTKDPDDPFATARGMTEKQASLKAGGAPDFSQLLNMDDRELQLQAERRRASLVGASYQPGGRMGSLGIDFSSSVNPFADPKDTRKSNPFADPIQQPKATVSKENNYVADVRRSRGLYTDMTNHAPGTAIGTGAGGWRPPSTTPASRYPSTIAPSRDSYRDTVYSSFSTNARKGKGRSDPFDLERPELWRRDPIPAMPETNHYASNQDSMMPAMERESAVPNPLTISPPSRFGQAHQRNDSSGTYESKYSSGVSLGGFGDPGPDIGPGSGPSSLQNGFEYPSYLKRGSSPTTGLGGVGRAR